MYGHTDQAKYESGLRTCRNALVIRQGVTANRNGTSFVGAPRNGASAVRLFKFVFSNTQARLLVFSDRLIQVVINGAFTSVAVSTPYAAVDLFGLNIAQSADVLTIVHANYPPATLSRLSDTNWVYTPMIFGPSTAAPASVTAFGVYNAIGHVWQYGVTAIDGVTQDESYMTKQAMSEHWSDPTQLLPHVINWMAVSGASAYNVYISVDHAAFILLASVPSNTLTNAGVFVPDVLTTPPVDPVVFTHAGDYPSVTGYYQQRRMFGNSRNNPGRVWGSRSGRYNNFSISSPTQNDDAVIFDLVANGVSRVQQLVDLGRLLVATEGSEWLVDGDSGNVLSPTAINARIGSYNGSSALRTLQVDFNVLYLQSLGTTIRKLTANILYGYYTFAGEDLTLFASHLFEGFSIVDWDWAQQPNYCVWAVRSDGMLLGMTFIPEQQLQAWHRHDTPNGAFESIATLPEDGLHAVYVVVRRVINGETVRYVERFNPRLVVDQVRDARFMDASLSYDGTNLTPACTMVISGGGPDTSARPYSSPVYLTDERGAFILTETGQRILMEGGVALPALSGWGNGVPLTLTCACAQFTADDVGGAYFITSPDAVSHIRFTITSITSPTVALGTPDVHVPSTMRNAACSVWSRAVARVGNLWHLEGQAVSIYADGAVVASPNNPDYELRTVHGGQVTLDKPYAVICVGLPYCSDIETLDIDTPHGPSAKSTRMNVTAVGLYVHATRGLFIGRRAPRISAVDGLIEMKLRDTVAMGLNAGQPVLPVTKYIEQDIESEWNSNGRIFIRQIDPVPAEILSITALGFVPVGAA